MSSDLVRQIYGLNYGDVDGMDVDQSGSECRRAIRRITVECARSATAHKQHTTDGSSVIVSIRRQTNLLEVNDDCMEEIFKHFNGNDLSRVAQVCDHLRTLALLRFVSKRFYKTLEFDANTVESIDDVYYCLQLFGSLVHTIKLSNDSVNQIKKRYFIRDVLSRLAKCDLTKIRRLEFSKFHFSDVEAEEDAYLWMRMRPVFNHLQTLVLEECVISEDFFMSCDKVDEVLFIRTNVEFVYSSPYWYTHKLRCFIRPMNNIFYVNPCRVTEFTVGYPDKCKVEDVIEMCVRKKMLERLTVILNCDKTPEADDGHLVQSRVDSSLKDRINSLSVIIVGNESQIRPIAAAVVPFKITCLLAENVMKIFNVKHYTDIKMCIDQTEILRKHGLLQ